MVDVQVNRKIGVSPRARIPAFSSAPPSPTRSSRLERKKISSTPSHADQLRPRAKVSSSATIATSKKPPSTLSPEYASGSATPRASSPLPISQQDSRKGRLSPNSGNAATTKLLSRVRSRPALSAVSLPPSPRVVNVKAEYASLSAATSDSALGPPRVRQPSISSISQITSHTTASNGVCSPPLSAVSFSQDSDAQSNISTHRIKAKVSSMVKGKMPGQGQTIPSPVLMPSPALHHSASQAPLSPGPQIHRRLGRTLSIGSFSTSPTPPEVYPITTSNPAANVHRYSTFRRPSYSSRAPHPFTSPLQKDQKQLESDSLLAPPPPPSPPASSVSSSRSSVARSSLSLIKDGLIPNAHPDNHEHLTETSDPPPMDGPNANCNSLVIQDPSEPDVDEISGEWTMKAEAKSHRKIADLEITTKSLLAINSQLEANKHKQAKEIRDLRRKLRESQLVLPPRMYRELKVSGEVVDTDKDDEEPEEQEIEVDEDAKWKAEGIRLGKEDEAFDRLRLIIENLLATGKRALALKVDDLAPPKGAAKVLHEVEARSWREGLPASAIGGNALPECGAADDAKFEGSSSSSSDYGRNAISRMPNGNPHDRNGHKRSQSKTDELMGNSGPTRLRQ